MQTIDNGILYDTLTATKIFGFFNDTNSYMTIYSNNGIPFGHFIFVSDLVDVNVSETYEGKFQMFNNPHVGLEFLTQSNLDESLINMYKREFNV